MNKKGSFLAGGLILACLATQAAMATNPPAQVYTFDMSLLGSQTPSTMSQARVLFEQTHFVTCLQGIVNRTGPRLYLYAFNENKDWYRSDAFWMNWMRRAGGWLEHTQLVPLNSLEELVQTFRSDINGVVVWDQDVDATSNVASTIAGVENLLPVRFDTTSGSLYDRVVAQGPQLPVRRNLVGLFTGTGVLPGSSTASTGSKKNDAYRWAKEQFLDTGKTKYEYMGYYVDAYWIRAGSPWDISWAGLHNQDFVVMKQGFIFDLYMWNDWQPNDDPQQPMGTDYNTLIQILNANYQRHGGQSWTTLCGFLPWMYKYCERQQSPHDGVAGEWETIRLTSAYNIAQEADALTINAMANASFYYHYPLPKRLLQNPPPTDAQLKTRGLLDSQGRLVTKNYVMLFCGDYDSPAWMYRLMPEYFTDTDRGSVPINWAFNPNNSVRVPQIFDYMYQNKTANDFFIAGDSGAGYVNPTQVLAPRSPSGKSSGEAQWVDFNRRFFRQLDYSITGFLINGNAGALTQNAVNMYRKFSGDGVFQMAGYQYTNESLLGTMPVGTIECCLPVGNYPDGDPSATVNAIKGMTSPGALNFLVSRSTILSPKYFKDTTAMLEAQPNYQFKVVDAYTFCYLLAKHLGGNNNYRATWISDNLPETLTPSASYTVNIAVRNDGWDIWTNSGNSRYRLAWMFNTTDTRPGSPTLVELPKAVNPGEQVTVTTTVTAPATAGTYWFRYDMNKRLGSYFEDRDNLPWAQQVQVALPSPTGAIPTQTKTATPTIPPTFTITPTPTIALPSLLINGDFESGFTTNVGTNWMWYRTTGYNASFQAGEDYFRSSFFAQRMTCVQPVTPDSKIGIYQTVAVTSSRQYRLTAWFRSHFGGTESSSSENLMGRLGIDLTGGTNWQAGSVQWYEFNSGHDMWQYLERTITASSASLTVFLEGWRKLAQGGSDATVWFDDIALADLSATPAPTPTRSPTIANSPTPTRSPTPSGLCLGDTNGDLFVNGDDYRMVRDHFGTGGCGVLGDANGDCFVNGDDYRMVRDYFGHSCL